MYLPKAFEESRPEVLAGLIRAHSFGTLVSQADGELVASHLPLLIDEGPAPHGVLLGHMARANPQWQGFREDREVLAIFAGPHAYVSPSWYETELSVPTWNYAAVHVYGVPRLIEEPVEVRGLLERTVRTYEAGFAEPWEMSRLPGDWVERLQRAIVGFRIEITRMEGKLKMSQNRSAEDRAGAIAGLRALGDAESAAVADWMARLAEPLNPPRLRGGCVTPPPSG